MNPSGRIGQNHRHPVRLHISAILATLACALAPALPLQQARSPLLDPAAPAFAEPAPARSTVRLDTSKGRIDIEVARAWSPRGSDRFVALVRHHYYDDTRFFRVRPGRWVQFGINGDPGIAQAWRGRTIEDDPLVQSNVRGTVAFAFAVPTAVPRRCSSTSATMRLRTIASRSHPSAEWLRGMDVADALNAEYGEGPGGIRAGQAGSVLRGRQCVAAAPLSTTRLHPDRTGARALTSTALAGLDSAGRPARQGDTRCRQRPQSSIRALIGFAERQGQAGLMF